MVVLGPKERLSSSTQRSPMKATEIFGYWRSGIHCRPYA